MLKYNQCFKHQVIDFYSEAQHDLFSTLHHSQLPNKEAGLFSINIQV
ncbi:hypothetical protein [Mannheimia granulomatis]|nr:hypothetical protein [Mannheimia granulomatis]